MLRNCRITSINQLLFIMCRQCKGMVVKLGGSRAVIQQRSTPFLELPDFIQRQQLQLELKEHVQHTDLYFYCNQCNTHIHCYRTFLVKLSVYCASRQELKELTMYDEIASQFFGCTAETFVDLSRNDKDLMHRLEDYLTERTWNITLQYKKKKETDKIVGLVPLLTSLPNEPLVQYLCKKNIPASSNSPSLVLDSSLACWF